MVQKWTFPYLCPGDGVLKRRELGNQFGRLVLLTYRSILQFKKSHTEIRRSSAHLSQRTANFKRWTHEIRSSVAFEPGVGRCCGWNRSCKPTVWRGSRPEQELVLDFSVFILKLTCFILKFQKKRKKVHLTHGVENSFAGLPCTSDRVILDRRQIWSLLQKKRGKNWAIWEQLQ